LLFLCSFIFMLSVLDDGVKAGVWAYGLAYVFPVLWLILGLRPHGIARRPSFASLKAQMRIGLPSYIAELIGYLFYRVNLLLIGYFSSDEQAGYFAIVVLITESMWFLANSVGTALLPAAAGRPLEELRVLVPKAVRHVVFLTACCVVLLFSVDRWLIGLAFGNDFLPSVSPLRWLYLGIIAASAAKIFASYLLSQGRPHQTAAIGGAGLVANLALCIWLIPALGIDGAAIAASCSYIVMVVLMGMLFVRETRVPVGWLFCLSREDFLFYRDVLFQIRTRIRS
jgi:O-antigen/teichoic acid export membrane protein